MQSKEDTMTVSEQTRMDTLVTTDWLKQHLNDPDLVVLDCTVSVKPDDDGGFQIVSGRADYDAGHIPGAGFADLLGNLSDRDSSLWVAMPTPEQFCAAMGALGVGDDCRVVLYDGNQSVWAARVWWMLRWVGFDRAALLDGGLKVWTAEGRPLSTEPYRRPAKQLTLALRPELIADRDEAFAALNDNNVCLIDTLPADSYRAQHIPGASNLDALNLLDETGRYRPHDELDAMHNGDRNARTITYCGGGVAASSNAFVMTRLGFTNVAVYAASLQEWAANPVNPLVVEKS
jgi:thiosulfate/3-mercaptopyruvate sulfurtransferase